MPGLGVIFCDLSRLYWSKKQRPDHWHHLQIQSKVLTIFHISLKWAKQKPSSGSTKDFDLERHIFPHIHQVKNQGGLCMRTHHLSSRSYCFIMYPILTITTDSPFSYTNLHPSSCWPGGTYHTTPPATAAPLLLGQWLSMARISAIACSCPAWSSSNLDPAAKMRIYRATICIQY